MPSSWSTTKPIGLAATKDYIVAVLEDGSVWYTTHPGGQWHQGTPVPNTARAMESGQGTPEGPVREERL